MVQKRIYSCGKNDNNIKTDDTMFSSTSSFRLLDLFHFFTSRAPSGWPRRGTVPGGHGGRGDLQMDQIYQTETVASAI